MNVIFRDAVYSDIPNIAALCFDYFVELDVGMPGSTLDKKAVVDHLLSRIKPSQAPMILATCNGLIVGMYGLELDRYWWMQEYHVSDYIWYVHPDFRHLNLGGQLRQKASDWAASKGLCFRPVVMNLDRLEAKDRSFRMAGFQRVGSIYGQL